MKNLFFALAALGFAGLAGAADAATMDGETVRIDWLFPDDATVFDSSPNVIVGPGDEHVFFGVDATIAVDISGSTVFITSLVDNHVFLGSAFNGIRITDILGTIADFVGFAIITNGFNNVEVTFDANNLFFNFANNGSTGVGDLLQVEIFFADAEIPIPAALPLFLTALGGLAFAARRRRARAASA